MARIRDNADSSVAQSASVCEIEGCGDPVHRRRWCRHHYQVWQRSGDPLKGKRQRPSIRTYCSIEGCVRISNSRGWCDRHYYAWYRTGDPLSTDKRRKSFDRVKYDIRCENAIAKGVTHTCTMCGGTKPVQEFVKSRARRDGFTNRCLICTRSLDKDRPKRIRTTRKESWPLAPIPKSRECESCHRVLPIEQFTKNSEYSFGRTYECKKCNNKKCREIWSQLPPEKLAERKAASLKWHKANPDASRSIVRNRRARIRNSEGRHAADDIERIYKLQRGKCAICRKPLGNRYSVDHIQPISGKGHNGPSNLQLVHKECNSKKGSKDPIDFMRELGFLL